MRGISSAERPEPVKGPGRHIRWSLRARLIALVLAVAAVALIAVGVVIPISVRATMMAAKKQTLVSVVDNLRSMGPGSLSEQLGAVTSRTPLGGEVGWSLGYESGVTEVRQAISSMPDANPAVGWDTSTVSAEVVSDVDRPKSQFLALGLKMRLAIVGRADVVDATVVAWVPLSDVHATTQRLIVIEIAVSAGLLLLLGTAAGMAIRRELRPLEAMAHTADVIAAGDLAQRVAPAPAGTEVGRLGTAFNGMLDSISGLLSERAASEGRMRQFVADASHELRTPVAAVRGYTDLYRAGALNDAAAIGRAMERMGFESHRMGALVEDLLTLTQADAEVDIPAETVDIVPLLGGVIDDARVIDDTRTWRLQAAVPYALVRGDGLRLHQLFANLLANVRTHTPPGTTTTVHVQAAHASYVPGVSAHAWTGGGVVHVSVVDNGPGVDGESRPRLFDRFFRVDQARSREQGGSGLGLSIVAAIVRMHRGQVWASPTPGGGLTITVQLPWAFADSASEGSAIEGKTFADNVSEENSLSDGVLADGASADAADEATSPTSTSVGDARESGTGMRTADGTMVRVSDERMRDDPN